MAALTWAAGFCLLCLCVLSDCAHSTSIDNEIYDVINALDKLILYFKHEYKRLNLDGFFGLRVLEGQLQLLLEEHKNGRHQHITAALLQNITHLHDMTLLVSAHAIKAVKQDDLKYFGDFNFLVHAPWRIMKPHKKLVPSLRWEIPQYKTKLKVKFEEELSDKCMKELLSSVNGVCNISDTCGEVMTHRGYTGYLITHQVLWSVLGEIMVNCTEEMNSVLAQRDMRNIESMQLEMCTNDFFEMVAVVQVLMHGTVHESHQDLFLEQQFICPNLGFYEFLKKDYLTQILSWQFPSGCFGETEEEEGEEDEEEEEEGDEDKLDLGSLLEHYHKSGKDVTQPVPGLKFVKEGITGSARASDMGHHAGAESHVANFNAAGTVLPRTQSHGLGKQEVAPLHNGLPKKENRVERREFDGQLQGSHILPQQRLQHHGAFGADTLSEHPQQKLAPRKGAGVELNNTKKLVNTFPVSDSLNRSSAQQWRPAAAWHASVPSATQGPHVGHNVEQAKTDSLPQPGNHGVQLGMQTFFAAGANRPPVNDAVLQAQRLPRKKGDMEAMKGAQALVNGASPSGRKLLAEKEMGGGCLSHKTGVAAGALVMYLRYLIDPGPIQWKGQHDLFLSDTRNLLQAKAMKQETRGQQEVGEGDNGELLDPSEDDTIDVNDDDEEELEDEEGDDGNEGDDGKEGDNGNEGDDGKEGDEYSQNEEDGEVVMEREDGPMIRFGASLKSDTIVISEDGGDHDLQDYASDGKKPKVGDSMRGVAPANVEIDEEEEGNYYDDDGETQRGYIKRRKPPTPRPYPPIRERRKHQGVASSRPLYGQGGDMLVADHPNTTVVVFISMAPFFILFFFLFKFIRRRRVHIRYYF